MNRRIVFCTVVALAGLVVLAVAEAILVSVTDTEQLLLDAGSGFTAYLAIFGLVFADAIVPIFPGETTLNAASVLASQGQLELELVIVAGALGAVLGDSTLYWIARTGPRKLKARLESASQTNERVEKGSRPPREVWPAADHVRPVRARRSLRRQRLHGRGRLPLPALPALLDHRRRDLGDLHVRPRLLGRDRARRFPGRLDHRLRRRHDRPDRRRLLDRPPPSHERGGAGPGAGHRDGPPAPGPRSAAWNGPWRPSRSP